MKRLSGFKAFAALAFAGLFAAAPYACADGSAPAPAPPAAPDEINQVLEIPQQCGKEAVTMLCDRSTAVPDPDAPRAFAADAVSPGPDSPLPGLPQDGSAAAPSDDPTKVAYGSRGDYESQFEPSDSAPVVQYLPMPVFVPMLVTPAYSFGVPPRWAAPRSRFIRPHSGSGRGRR